VTISIVRIDSTGKHPLLGSPASINIVAGSLDRLKLISPLNNLDGDVFTSKAGERLTLKFKALDHFGNFNVLFFHQYSPFSSYYFVRLTMRVWSVIFRVIVNFNLSFIRSILEYIPLKPIQ